MRVRKGRRQRTILKDWAFKQKMTRSDFILERNSCGREKDVNYLQCTEEKFVWKWLLNWLFPSFSVQFSCSVMSDSLRSHGLQHVRLPCPSPTPRTCSNSCLLSRWCHPTTSSLSSPSPPAFNLSQHQGLFPISQFFASGGQSIGVSALAQVLPMNIQHWFPLGLTGMISLQSKGLSRVFSNITVQKHQFFSA